MKHLAGALGPILGADNLIVSTKNKEKNIENYISHDHLTIGAEFDVKAGGAFRQGNEMSCSMGIKLELNELRLTCFRSKNYIWLTSLDILYNIYIFVFFNYLYLFLTAFKNSALIYNNRNDFITWPIEDLHPN